MGPVAVRRVGVGYVFDDDRTRPEQVWRDLHVLDDLLAKGQIGMRSVDAGVDDGDAHPSAGKAEFGPDPIGSDERDALVEEIIELPVVVDGPDAREAKEAPNLSRGAPHTNHRERAKPENLNARGPDRPEHDRARVLAEGYDGLDELAWPGGTKYPPKSRVDLGRRSGRGRGNTRELGGHRPSREREESDHDRHRPRCHVPAFFHAASPSTRGFFPEKA